MTTKLSKLIIHIDVTKILEQLDNIRHIDKIRLNYTNRVVCDCMRLHLK